MARLCIQQVRSAIGRKKDQKKTLIALGITKVGRKVIHNDTPQIRGMINKISHLLEVSEIDDTSQNTMATS